MLKIRIRLRIQMVDATHQDVHKQMPDRANPRQRRMPMARG